MLRREKELIVKTIHLSIHLASLLIIRLAGAQFSYRNLRRKTVTSVRFSTWVFSLLKLIKIENFFEEKFMGLFSEIVMDYILKLNTFHVLFFDSLLWSCGFRGLKIKEENLVLLLNQGSLDGLWEKLVKEEVFISFCVSCMLQESFDFFFPTGSKESRRGTVVFVHGAPTQSFSYRTVMSQVLHCILNTQIYEFISA